MEPLSGQSQPQSPSAVSAAVEPGAAAEAAQLRPAPARAITARSLIIGLLLIPINVRWIAQTELVYWMFPTYFVPFYNTLVTMMLLALANMGLRAIVQRATRSDHRPGVGLTTAEMLVIFLMLNTASALMSHNMMEILVFFLPLPKYMANDPSPWVRQFAGHVPSFLLVSDPVAVKNYYLGNSSIYLWENLRPWLVPCAIWTAFIAVLLWVMACLTSILRKQWIVNERLSFPVVPMYVEMIDERGELYRNRTMWLGFAFAGGLTLWNGFAYIYPWLPAIHFKPTPHDELFQNHPWNALLGTRFGVLFSTVAIAFFMPLDLSMSCWIYYLIFCVQRVLFQIYAISPTTSYGLPNTVGLTFGTYVGVFLLGVWVSKHHLRNVIAAALKPGKAPRDPGDPLTAREAVFGAAIGIVLLGAFAHMIGMAAWVVPLFFAIYIILAVMITRIRAEFSFPCHDLHNMGPHNGLIYLFGSSAMSPGTLSAFSMLYWFNRVYASHPMPHLMEALKMNDSVRAESRTLVKVFVLTAVYGSIVVFWSCLELIYARGAATAKMNGCPVGLAPQAVILQNNAILNPAGPDVVQCIGAAVGLVTALGLGMLRRQFAFFPFHPLGIAMAPSWAMWFLWMSMLVGSAAKAITLKFGGLRAYRKAVPFFIGTLLGEFVVGGLWTVAGIIFHVRTYTFFE